MKTYDQNQAFNIMAVVRRLLKSHKLTEVGDGVVEADIAYAVLDVLKKSAPKADYDLRNIISNAIHGYGEMLGDHTGTVDAIAKAVIPYLATSVMVNKSVPKLTDEYLLEIFQKNGFFPENLSNQSQFYNKVREIVTGAVGVAAMPPVLTEKEIDFVQRVLAAPRAKLNGAGEAVDYSEGAEVDALWERPEKLNMVLVAGSYKWTPNPDLVQAVNTATRQAIQNFAHQTETDQPQAQTKAETDPLEKQFEPNPLIDRIVELQDELKQVYVELASVQRKLIDANAEIALHLMSKVPTVTLPSILLKKEQVEWVVNSLAELGVKINNQFFFLYKGDSLVYEHPDEEHTEPLMWRPVFTREFGECAHPINHEDYSKKGTVSPGDSEDWKPLPKPPTSHNVQQQADREKELEGLLASEKRKTLELQRVYDERGLQITRLETELERFQKGTSVWHMVATTQAVSKVTNVYLLKEFNTRGFFPDNIKNQIQFYNTVRDIFSRIVTDSLLEVFSKSTDIRGPMTEHQKQEARALYRNMFHLGPDAMEDVVRYASVCGYVNGHQDSTLVKD